MDLKKILEGHKKWLHNAAGGVRADLSGANLMRSDLRDADLSGANLMRADLMRSDLRGADLMRSDLRDADLRGADLRGADLRDADLRDADLRGADLMGAVLRGAIADENTAGFWLCCPEVGAFVGWKKLAGGVIAKLLIPEDARRSSATTRKCRADKAVVLWLSDDETSTPSKYDSSFMYTVGETVSVPDFCDDRWQECAAGIHFFITRAEAEAYNA